MQPNPAFTQWLRQRAKAAGYDVGASRGARLALAKAAAISPTQVGRTLTGDTMPSVESQRGLAKALGIPVAEMLVRSGTLAPEDILSRAGTPAASEVDPYRLAREWGIPEDRVELFVSCVEALADGFRRNSGESSQEIPR
ncbi:hypothetical protein ACIQGZ_17130 [Streptomyces sp. NPDC092296]|uniref:hypothetical protein n=1 Tax=Streptomyces sp. NPDC092296 TaxID=3366012 RepID=UPI003830DDC8